MFEEAAQFVVKALTRFDKIIDHFPVFQSSDIRHDFAGTFNFARNLDKKQLELARDANHFTTLRSILDVGGPIVNPLAQGVGVENATGRDNGNFEGIPVR
ncbi:uncharacterized protein PpBr36_05791 [Pyricularia pennisetigena]|uniref:uncharacterized protein n=1 Tax=Pyricularia pennisetigena TaxID=1578925 RepID=UPI0011548818|nr:uncharacterized protein PpBr36_05791 [Pyricularia pennisetigena]TLS22856.1 hypothetical protein PpBr36_05791 [Pyricularia pennisetigena]